MSRVTRGLRRQAGETSGVASRSDSMLAAVIPAAALTVPVLWELQSSGHSAGYVLLGIPLIVIAIASDTRMGWERALETRGLPERESWLPATYIALGFVLGAFNLDTAWEVMGQKLDLIGFILAFALVSEGLSKSGLFHFLAFRISERCEGSTARLLFYLFILASVLTAVTSNDIVVLSLTPIVISVCYQARIRNVRLILLSTFVAANTLSMALLIGSPTNIILAEALHLNGFTYTVIMAVPSLFAFLATYLAISRIVRWVERGSQSVGASREGVSKAGGLFPQPSRRWEYCETYTVPQFSEHHRVTQRMVRWIWVFAASVLGLFVVSMFQASLWWIAIPTALLAIAVAAHDRDRPMDAGPRTVREEATAVRELARVMPWGILFFGLSFFVVAASFAETPFFANEVVHRLNGWIGDGGPFSGIIAIAGTGIVVNLFNDLPAAALFAETLPALNFPTDLHSTLVTMAVLAGLNIGTYVTPTGALAGLIWFRLIRHEADRLNDTDGTGDHTRLEVPSRGDLFRFGSMVFLFVTIVLGLILYAIVSIVAYLVSDVDRAPVFGDVPGGLIGTLLGVFLAVATIVLVRRELRRRNVVLAHLRDAFVFLHRFSAWALRHPMAYATVVVTAVLTIAATMLYWSERYHSQIYGTTAQFSTLKGYLSWLVAFVGSGYEQELFPVSLLGILLSGLLPLLGIAAIVRLLRAPTDASSERLRERLAQGEADAQ